jgi:hypothetical protein
MLLRAYAAYAAIPTNATIFRHEIFDAENAHRMRVLLRGPANAHEENPVLHVVQTISKVLGHGSARTAISDYIHVIDLVFHLIMKNREKQEISMTTRQIMDFLQVRYERLPTDLRGDTPKVMTGARLLEMQRQLLKGKPLCSPSAA